MLGRAAIQRPALLALPRALPPTLFTVQGLPLSYSCNNAREAVAERLAASLHTEPTPCCPLPHAQQPCGAPGSQGEVGLIQVQQACRRGGISRDASCALGMMGKWCWNAAGACLACSQCAFSACKHSLGSCTSRWTIALSARSGLARQPSGLCTSAINTVWWWLEPTPSQSQAPVLCSERRKPRLTT